MIANKGHPNQSTGRQRKREDLRESKRHTLENELFAGEMAKCHDIGPVCNVVHGPNVQVIRRIATYNGRNKSPSTKQPTGQGSHLICRLGVVLGGHELVDGVFGVERRSRGWQFCVSDEAAIVDASCEVKG